MYKDLLGQEGDIMGELDSNAISLIGNDEFYAYVFFRSLCRTQPHHQERLINYFINLNLYLNKDLNL